MMHTGQDVFGRKETLIQFQRFYIQKEERILTSYMIQGSLDNTNQDSQEVLTLPWF